MPTKSNRILELIKRRRAVLKATGRKLPQRRKPPKQLYPMAIERSYYASIMRLLNPMLKEVRERLIPAIPDIIEQYKAETKVDTKIKTDAVSYGETITRIISNIRIGTTIQMTDTDIRKTVDGVAGQTNKFNKNQIDKQFETVLGIPVLRAERWLEPQVAGFVETNVALIKSIPEEHLKRVEQMLRAGVESGESTRTLTKKIREQFFGYDTAKGKVKSKIQKQANLISRDQISKYNGKLTELRQTEAGVKKYIWRVSDDERLREKHAEVADETFSWDDPPAVGNNGERHHPGGDYQCIPSEAKVVIFSDIQRLFRRWYTGKSTKIITDSGISFNATPNHPVLTRDGWKPLKDINIGDYVFSTQFKSPNFFKQDIKNVVASIEEMFDFFLLLFSTERVSGLTSQFHGDGSDKDIDIITINSGLLDTIYPTLSQEICQEFLTKAKIILIDLPANSNFIPVFNSLFPPSTCDISFFSKLFFLLNRQLTHSDDISFTATSRLYSVAKELIFDGRSLDTILFGDSLRTHPGNIIVDSIFYSKLFSIICRAVNITACINTPSSKMLAEIVRVDGKSNPNLIEGSSFIKKPLRVVEKFSSEFSNHVYNLQTGNGWYSANDLIIKNCRCTAEPIMDEFIK